MKRNIILLKGLFVVLLAGLALEAGGQAGLAAPSRAEPPPPVPLVCSTNIARHYCDLQVVLLIDDTGSMRSNDPTHMRDQGAKNLVDILAREYYQPAVDAQALDPGVALPDIKVAVIHFSQCISKEPLDHCDKDVKFNSGWLPITARDQLYQDIDWLDTQPTFYHIFQFTRFPEPFQAAVDLFNAPEAAPKSDCVRRLVLLLTDGTPEDRAGPLGEPALGQQMGQVKDILKDFLARLDDHVYVTAFKVVNRYWQATEPYWQDIAGAQNVSLEKSLDEVASRMEKIAAPNIGVQSYTLGPGVEDPQLYQFTALPHLESLRITYYKLDPASTLTITDPQGNPLSPNGDIAQQTGRDTSIEVWTLTEPPPGIYQIRTSLQGGIVTAIPLYAVSVQLDSPGANRPLVQYMDGEIRFQLLDGAGQPVLPTDNPAYTLDLQANLVNEAGASLPLSLALESQAYQADWIPPAIGKQVIRIRAELTDTNNNSAWSCEGDAGEVQVDPVTVKADVPGECTPVNTPLVVPLQLADARTGIEAGTRGAVRWQVNAVTVPGGRTVDGSVQAVDAGAGKYELRLTPRTGEDIRTHLTASVTLGDQPIQIYEGDFTTTVCAIPTPSPTPFPPPPPPAPSKCGPSWNCIAWMLILLIVALLTWPFSRRRDDENRFPFWLLLTLLLILLLCLSWLFVYCGLAGPLWLLLLILVAILLLWLAAWLICHYLNPLWGVIGILNDDDQALWSARLADSDGSDGRGCYDWELKKPICDVRRIRVRSWNRRRHRLALIVTFVKGGKIFERSLDDWRDCNLGDGCRIAWQEIGFEWTARKPSRTGARGKSRPGSKR
jgi:hypothetical protein